MGQSHSLLIFSLNLGFTSLDVDIMNDSMYVMETEVNCIEFMGLWLGLRLPERKG